MTIKELFVADLKATLEETANIMADRVILESLAKHGSVTLEEAEFYDSLVRRVVTEAAEEFVPEKLEMPLIQESEGGEPMILTGEDGTVYNFNPATCELIPVDGAEGADEAQDGLADLEGPGAEALGESTETKETLVEESEVSPDNIKETKVEGGVETDETVEAEPEELTESQMIVSNLIKSLGA
jgi:hypothetical protein